MEETPLGRSLLQGGASSWEEPPHGRSLLQGGAQLCLRKYAFCATLVAKIGILRNYGGPHMWSLHIWSLHMWSLHMWSLHLDFLANLIKFARCLANHNNFARSPCKFV